MDPLTTTAASGLRTRMESLDLLANNLANSETGGYKADREFSSLYASAEAAAGAAVEGALPSTSPDIEQHWTDFSQGSLRVTSNALDFAISGRGFFSVAGPSGPLYTRNGNFRLSPAGMLVTQDGYAVSVNGGKPLQVRSNTPLQVSPDGTVQQDGQAIGRIEVVDFDDTGALAKRGENYFVNSGAPARPAAAEVHQGKLENSNVTPAESAVRLVAVLRQFETLQKAISLGADMNRRAVEDVARVSG